MSSFQNSSLRIHVGGNSPPSLISAENLRPAPILVKPLTTPIPFASEGQRVLPMNRKRRTVLWLFNEDYEYLSAVAEHDMDTKNVSMHRLVKALRAAGIKSFLKLEEGLRRSPQSPGR